ncbi:OmpA family protein [Chitinophaga sp. 30R24]
MLTGTAVQAQSRQLVLQQADDLYEQKEYYAAAQVYEKYLTALPGATNVYAAPFSVKKIKKKSTAVQSTHQEAMYKLAESYRLCHHYKAAATWYEKAIAIGEGIPYNHYWYGVALRANQQLDAAENEFNIFLKNYTTADKYTTDAQRELENIRFIREQLQEKAGQASLVKPLIAGEGVLTTASALSWQDADSITFTGVMHEGKMYNNRLYRASIHEDKLQGISLFKLEEGVTDQEAASAYTPDGRFLFFTRWQVKKGKEIAAIYRSERIAGAWSKPVKLDAAVNVEGYNALQPFVTADGGHLLFASDQPGGYGSYDLWVTTLDANGVPAKALNMGAIINTASDEFSPFYHSRTGQLVFASNGRTGMGGLDLYKSQGDFKQWQQPENMGYPVNSTKDDLYFIGREQKDLLEQAYISSDRASDCCLELFAVNIPTVKKEVPSAPVPVPVQIEALPPAPVAEVVEKDTSWFIHFDFDKAALRPSALEELDALAAVLQKDTTLRVEIWGHTDGKGTDVYNLHLANMRANACIQYLISKRGIKSNRITGHSMGKSMPVATEMGANGIDIPQAREMNRRVECRVVGIKQ